MTLKKSTSGQKRKERNEGAQWDNKGMQEMAKAREKLILGKHGILTTLSGA